MKKLILELGGVGISIESKEQEIIRLAKEAFKDFTSSNKKYDITISVAHDRQLDGANPYMYGNPHRTNVLSNNGKIFARGSVYSGVFDLKTLRAEVRQGMSKEPLYLFLRFVVSVYLPMVNGFLLHSTSVARNGACFLFSGRPQSGKSTVARLSSDYQVLSDDFSIVRKVGGKFCCFGSPFWGHVEARGANTKEGPLPVKALYLIKQDDDVYIRKLNKNEATFRLIENISVLAKDNGINRRIIKIADEFTDEVSVNNLHFKLDKSFWRCIENG